MHIQTHILTGWNIGNIFRINPRERFFCMLAASLQDIDGLGIIISQKQYWNYHHVLGHGIFFGAIISLIMAFFSEHKIKAFFIYLALVHIHLLQDLVGSGELWGISYFWPLSGYSIQSAFYWPLTSWQNFAFGLAMLIITVLIIYYRKRSPVEYIMPETDKKIVAFFERLAGRKKNQNENDNSQA
jgi:hypothetical protein